jgi:hypothetical protein
LGQLDGFTPGEPIVVWCEGRSAVLYYRFDLKPQGYVVVAGDYGLPPVIAYSLTGAFGSETDTTNPLANMLRQDLRHRLQNLPALPEPIRQQRHAAWVEYLDADAADRLFQQWPPPGTTSTGGWLETTWHQNAPYSDLCPMDLVNGSRSVAGCPAVAMAQILNYRERINGTRFDDGDDYYHAYGGNSFWIDNDYVTYDFPSFPELNAYLDTLVGHYQSATPLTDQDKAALTFACGTAATQVYNAAGSGTFGVDQAFDAYIRFGCDTIELLDESDTDLYSRLSRNMKNADPAHLAVVNPTWTSGHNLVVDGYNTDGFYHLNFGWGGPYDGWYLLPDDMPYGLTVIEGIIVDIMPNDWSVPTVSQWGVATMTLLVLTAGSLVFTRRRPIRLS